MQCLDGNRGNTTVQRGILPVPGAGALYATPGVPVELVLTGMGGAKPGIPGAPGA